MRKPPSRIELALSPTPIMKLERVSRRLGVELYMKRDDLTRPAGIRQQGPQAGVPRGRRPRPGRRHPHHRGHAPVELLPRRLGGGGPARAPRGGGGEGRAARRLRRQSPPEPHAGRGRPLSHRCGVRELSGGPRGHRGGGARGGGRPYVIPESGSNETGALGYLECAVELAEQIGHGAPRFDTVAITSFSGGSQAGLLMGKQLAGLPSEIVSVPIAFPPITCAPMSPTPSAKP